MEERAHPPAHDVPEPRDPLARSGQASDLPASISDVRRVAERLDGLEQQLDRIEADVAAIREAAQQLAGFGEQVGAMLDSSSSPAGMLGALMRPGGD